jgi:hypothetical protein
MLILAAPECKLAWVVFTLGILSLLGSLLIVILGKDRVRARIIWWAERPALVMRILGLVALAIGALLIYSA